MSNNMLKGSVPWTEAELVESIVTCENGNRFSFVVYFIVNKANDVEEEW